ncbi:MAG: YhbY family RNA-binding protein [Lachnospiraceae bacterium]|nr:YhbY family RNA-binding protein [Lachnospiraceae bacterium]
MTSKERAAFKTQAMQLDSIFQIGKSSLTPQMVDAIRDALKARELIKISVLKNCLDDPREIAQVLSERTGSEVIQVIGKKIVLYKKNYELEEKRKRAAKRKAGTARNAVAKGTARQSRGKSATAKNAVAKNAVAKNAVAKSAARQNSSGKKATGKQLKWSDR